MAKEGQRYKEVTSQNYYEVFPSKLRLHQLDPLSWYKERWLGDPNDFKWSNRPEYLDHNWDGSKDPLFQIWDSIACSIWTGVESGTSVGKSFLASIIVFWFLDVYRDDTYVVVVGPNGKQLKLTLGMEIKKKFPKFQRLHPKATWFNSFEIAVDTDDLEKSKWRMYLKAVDIKAGEVSNVSVRGVHAKNILYVIDEATGVPPSVYNAIENTCTAPNNVILAMGNPDNQTDPLHRFCMKSGVKHIIVSALDHPNVVNNSMLIEGGVSIDSIRMRAGKNGSEKAGTSYQSKVRGRSPKQGKNKLFSSQAWAKARKAFYHPDFKPDPWGENALGLDPANSTGGDKGAAVYGESNVVTDIQEFVCPDATHVAYNILHGPEWCADEGYNVYPLKTLAECDIWAEQVGIDGNGIGSGTVSTLSNLGYNVANMIGGERRDCIEEDAEGKPLHSFISFRAQIVWTLAKEFNAGEIVFAKSVDPAMIDQLEFECMVIDRVTNKAGGKIRTEDKDSLKTKLGGKSPNLLDAFAYWNWVRKDRYVTMSGGGIS